MMRLLVLIFSLLCACNTPAPIIEEPCQIILSEENENVGCLELILTSSTIPPASYEKLLRMPSGEVRGKVVLCLAKSAHTPGWVLEELVTDSSLYHYDFSFAKHGPGDFNFPLFGKEKEIPKVRIAIARNPNTSPKLLKKLAQDSSDEVRFAVAKNPRVSSQIQRRLFVYFTTDGGWNKDSIQYILYHKKCPLVVFAHAATHLSSEVRFLVARNRRTPENILAQLAPDTSKKVRVAVAKNPNTSPETLFLLYRDLDLQSVIIRNPRFQALYHGAENSFSEAKKEETLSPLFSPSETIKEKVQEKEVSEEKEEKTEETWIFDEGDYYAQIIKEEMADQQISLVDLYRIMSPEEKKRLRTYLSRHPD